MSRAAPLLLLAMAVVLTLTSALRVSTSRAGLAVRSANAMRHAAARTQLALHMTKVSTGGGNRAVLTRLACSAAGEAAPPAVAAGEVTELSRLEIRVGKIVEVGRHPDAEATSLFVEKVDVGEAEGPRTIVSGLVAYCTEEQLLNRNVVVLCNLKPRALKGITSFGMLLCASTKDGDSKSAVEPLLVPEGAKIGELVTFAGHKVELEPPGNRATKAFTKVADDLYVDDNGQATYKGTPFMTSVGAITSSMKKGSIS